ncbi:MAG: hypothetical protein ACI8XB_001792 [Patiriisocius sp.]|jgi:hypothetical protein
MSKIFILLVIVSINSVAQFIKISLEHKTDHAVVETNDITPIARAASLRSNNYLLSGSTSITNNLKFTLGKIDLSHHPIPIELINFNAHVLDNRTIKLEWQTQIEINIDYFAIELSLNGYDWQEISRINGAGDSWSLLSYSATDDKPFSGISYYRLKQTDFDGEYEYSQIRSINLKRLEDSFIEIYPNPVINQLTIIGNDTELKEITIYTILGQDVTLLTRKIVKNDSKLILDLSNLNSGNYLLKTKTTLNLVLKQ